MATVDIIKISDGTTDIGLILEDDGFQMLASGNDFGVPEHDNVYHESSYSNGAALVRERKKNRVWPMKLSVRGSTPDIVINNLITLAKHARQSARQQMLSDIDKVYLSIKIYGSTNTTYYDVVDIEVNGIDILSYINRNLQEIIFGNGLSISVTTKPLGYGDKEILCNILTYPDFHVDTNSDGLMDGWVEVGAGVTTARESTIKLHGAYCQKVTATGAGTGIVSDATFEGPTAADPYFAYAWVYRVGSSELTLTLRDNEDNSLDTTTYSASATTYTDSASREWRRLEVSGTAAATETALKIEVTSAGAEVFYVDKCYVSILGTAFPTAWSGSARIYNHTSTTASYTDGAYLNYIDVDDIPGDAPAHTQYEIEAASATTYFARAYIFKNIRAPYQVSLTGHNFTGLGSDASCVGGQYGGESVGTSEMPIGAYNSSPAAYNGQYAIFVRIYDTGTDGTLYTKMQFKAGASIILADPPYNEVQAQGQWLPQYFGAANLLVPESVSARYDNDGYYNGFMYLYAKRSAGSTTATVRVDYLFASKTEMFFCDCTEDTNAALICDSETGNVYGTRDISTGYEFKFNVIGKIQELDPLENTRLMFIFEDKYAVTDRWNIDTYYNVAIVYRPRTETLLGTI